MKKTLFEEMGGTYTLVGNYYLPDIELPTEEDNRPLSVWTQRSQNYVKRHRRTMCIERTGH